MQDQLYNLPIAAQVAFASGYVAYLSVCAGQRRDHTAADAVFMAAAFGLPALALFQTVAPAAPLWAAICLSFLGTMLVAALWRGFLRDSWFHTLGKLGVHRDDGRMSTWDKLIQRGDLRAGQVSVYTKDGRVLHLVDRAPFLGERWQGLYLGADGSVVLAVQSEQMPNGKIEMRNSIQSPEWGTRLTYIPCDQITRVNIRI